MTTGVVVQMRGVTVPCQLTECRQDAKVAVKAGEAKAMLCVAHVALWLRERGL